ncbi:hypothetical protein HYU40_01655 [Candidatus Woesearchaeota archaeon]|nr:hypothetical protein [Candidatus Woesearchaeota archaeon]
MAPKKRLKPEEGVRQSQIRKLERDVTRVIDGNMNRGKVYIPKQPEIF